ncbi:hypothetical protein OS493_028535 [Desmophyllum pertusum]|uniref:Uncharacterized protein n=1 Tax=Desmophyllum pertusum TaxID=174260 RepID=A0A9W9Z9A9_9CNID|nr:hypothetical protein OS493_028535 [Desmophyllum pertusum]
MEEIVPILQKLPTHFLDVLEEILDNEDQEDEEDEDEAELMSTEEVEKNFNNLMRCLSEKNFQKMMMTRRVMMRRTRRTRRMDVDDMEVDDNEVDDNNCGESSDDEKVTSEDEI